VDSNRDESEPSLHDKGKLTKDAISVCLVGGATKGGAPEDNFTTQQKSALSRLVLEVIERHPEVRTALSLNLESQTPALKTEEIFEWL
jgi:N-acetyl-anhydromuramyl-L-alanine amidase AmpD